MASEADDEGQEGGDEVYGLRVVSVGPDEAGVRLDKTLAALLPEFSRARLQALIAEGRVEFEGVIVTDASAKAAVGEYTLEIPPPEPAEPQPEAIPIVVLFEDPHLNATGGLAPLRLADGRESRVPLLPFTLDGQRPGLRLQPQPAGAQGQALLRELGYTEAEIAALRAGGVMGGEAIEAST